MNLVKSLTFIGVVFLSSLALTFSGLAGKIEAVDIPLHIFGGFAWALIALLILTKAQANTKPRWFTLLFCIGFVLIIGTLWEIAEYGLELIVNQNHLLTPLTVRDTLGDLFNDSLGAMLAWKIFNKQV